MEEVGWVVMMCHCCSEKRSRCFCCVLAHGGGEKGTVKKSDQRYSPTPERPPLPLPLALTSGRDFFLFHFHGGGVGVCRHVTVGAAFVAISGVRSF
jgi:hypothetical protein